MSDHLATTWLLTYAAHSALLTLLAAAIERTPWGAAPPRRDAVWKLALVGGAVSATVFAAMGSAPSGAAVFVPAAVVIAPQAEGGGIPWVMMVWIVVTAALVLRTVRAWRAGVRGAGRRRVIRRGPARAALDAIVGPGAGRVLLTCSRTIGVPVAFRREICVPVRALRELPYDELRALLAHEAAHVMRRDTAWLVAAAVVRVFGWWQPLNLLAAARLRLAMELCCDERAASGQPERDALARCLVKVAGWNVRDHGAAFAAMASRGPALRQRIASLLDETPRGERRPRAWLAVSAVTVPAIWLAPMITTMDVARLPAAAVRLVPRAITTMPPAPLPSPPAPAAPRPRRKDPVQSPATRFEPLPSPGADDQRSAHADSAGLPVAVSGLRAIEPSAAPSAAIPSPAATTLHAAAAAARIAPAPPRQDHRFDMPERERRALKWIAFMRGSHSFDPHYPNYDIR